MAEKIEVFVCYAHQDEALQLELWKQLRTLERLGLVRVWHNHAIDAGVNWKQEIEKRLNAAQIVLLLISADFMASDYCYSVEMRHALERQRRGKARVIPIILRPTEGWEKSLLGELQALPTNGQPVTTWRDRDKAFVNVAEGVRKVAEDLTRIPSVNSTEHARPRNLSAPSDPRMSVPEPNGKKLPISSRRPQWHLSGIISAFFLDIFRKLKQSDSEPATTPALDPFPNPTLSYEEGVQEVQLGITEPPARTEKVVSYHDVFLFNERLIDAKEFFGRKQERIILLERTRKASSTSIVGPRRIGKTWLIDYLMQVAPDQLGLGYRVGYLDATMPGCETVSGFTEAALESLGVRVWPRQAHLNLNVLRAAAKKLQEHNVTPILCIDEFEGLSNQSEFNLGFFIGLRAICHRGLLGLVIASKRTLLSIVGNNGYTSGFFNIFETCTLGPFTEKDAKAFVQIKGDQAKFSEQERVLLLRYGQQGEQQWHPLRLQLAGKMLLEDKDEGSCRPNDIDYQWTFKTRLEEKYRAVVEIQ